MNPYLDALAKIPSGETRSFMELAAMAGRPGAARAAGRAIASCRASSEHPTLPWHRVVPSDGRARDGSQRRRLSREGARPRARESVSEWAARVGARWIGTYGTRQCARPSDERCAGWIADQVEPFASESLALARGFTPVAAPRDVGQPLPTKRPVPTESESITIVRRYRDINWASVHHDLARDGVCRVRALLTPGECARILNASTAAERFERSIDMLPRGYGVGSYHYYREPLPEPALTLRELLYKELAPEGYPRDLSAFWHRCRVAGQKRASSILIGYHKGGINHPHRDVYGPVFFPFQALISLSKRGRDFSGGAFYVAGEGDMGKMKKIFVDEGDVVIFATRELSAPGGKVPLRHGMTLVTRGRRYGLGLVFHLAE